jgi:hypothetical protein
VEGGEGQKEQGEVEGGEGQKEQVTRSNKVTPDELASGYLTPFDS